MSLLKSKIQYYLIGIGGYNYNGREGLYLQCVENYEEGNELSYGSRGANVQAKFEDIKKIQDAVKASEIGLFKPAIIEFVPLTVQRGGNEVMTCEEVIQVTPFHVWHKPVSASSSAPLVPKDK